MVEAHAIGFAVEQSIDTGSWVGVESPEEFLVGV
jgi:hypothetical protein